MHDAAVRQTMPSARATVQVTASESTSTLNTDSEHGLPACRVGCLDNASGQDKDLPLPLALQRLFCRSKRPADLIDGR